MNKITISMEGYINRSDNSPDGEFLQFMNDLAERFTLNQDGYKSALANLRLDNRSEDPDKKLPTRFSWTSYFYSDMSINDRSNRRFGS